MKNYTSGAPAATGGAVFLSCLFLMAGCDSGGNAEPAKPETHATTTVQQQGDAHAIDACALISKAEMEQITGKPVLEPESEHLANLFTCAYGDPDHPGVSAVAGLSVFVFPDPADAKQALETTRSNAASVELAGDLGEDAYWDNVLRTLWAVKGKYEIGVETASDAGGFDSARKIAGKVLDRLP